MTFMDLAEAIISLTEFSLQGLIDFENSLVAAFRQLGYTLKDCNPLSQTLGADKIHLNQLLLLHITTILEKPNELIFDKESLKINGNELWS